VRINITMPADLLNQIDQYAQREGFTRSGFLTQAAKKAMGCINGSQAVTPFACCI
jgi:metal-responsive CopG/Arc/MetJ family transcriptional regulator